MGNRATPGKGKIVTPSDTVGNDNAEGTLYIGVGGDFPRRVKQVLAASTTATDIIVDK